MEIDTTKKRLVYEEAKKRKNAKPRKIRTDRSTRDRSKKEEYDSDSVGITNTLKGLYCLVNNKATCTKADVFFEPDHMTNCVIFSLMSMPTTKNVTFISKLRTRHPEKITAAEKIDYIERIREQLSLLSAESTPDLLKEYYFIEGELSADEEEALLQRYKEEWRETFDEWLRNIIFEIEDEEIDKKKILNISNKVKGSVGKYFDHNPMANIPFLSSFRNNGDTEELLGKISYLRGNTALLDFDRSEKDFLLKLLEEKIDDALENWQNTVDSAIERKLYESDFYVDADLE